jgi:hypothetical protein
LDSLQVVRGLTRRNAAVPPGIGLERWRQPDLVGSAGEEQNGYHGLRLAPRFIKRSIFIGRPLGSAIKVSGD